MKSFTHIHRTDEILVPHHHIGQPISDDDGKDPCANEPLDRLVRRQLDERGPSKDLSANVGKDIVRDDKARGQQKPDQALEDVVDDEMGLHNDQAEGHMRPRELRELKLVVSLFQGPHKEDKSWK